MTAWAERMPVGRARAAWIAVIEPVAQAFDSRGQQCCSGSGNVPGKRSDERGQSGELCKSAEPSNCE